MRALKAWLCCSVLPFALSACGGGGADDPVSGPCNVVATEPVLQIVAAVGSVGAEPIPTVTLSDFSINGVAVSGLILTNGSRNVVESGSVLVCTLSCGISTSEGQYRFTASAPGYVARVVSVKASYARLFGNCPATVSGGTQLSLTLDRT